MTNYIDVIIIITNGSNAIEGKSKSRYFLYES